MVTKDHPGRDRDRQTAQTPELADSIIVTKVTTDDFDVYGGRGRENGRLAHMNNTQPPATGWLGNPYRLDSDADDPDAERRRCIAAYLRDFLDRVEQDDDFRAAVEALRTKTVACWSRRKTQERDPTNFCHLDVVDAYLDGDLTPVYRYLRRRPTTTTTNP